MNNTDISSDNLPLIGAHVGSSGGLSKSVDRALEIGANCFQIFVSAPQRWKPPAHPDSEVEAFIEKLSASNIQKFFIHSIYLLNPSGPDEELRNKSCESIREYLRWAERLGAGGVIVHLGSSNNTTPQQAADNLSRCLHASLDGASNVPLLLETSAGTRNSMGSRFADLAATLRTLDAGTLAGVCLDTAHVWAAGYDVRSAEGVKRTFEEFDSEIGLDQLVLIHSNDSKTTLGGARDRHDDIGNGSIGLEGWHNLLSYPKLRSKPWVMETPGLRKADTGKPQVELLRRIWNGERVATTV